MPPPPFQISVLSDLLRRISYKPGWIFRIEEEPNLYGFVVSVLYDGYESENAAFTPLAGEDDKATFVRARLLGKNLRKPEKRYFRKTFDCYVLENMDIGTMIKYIIGQTIKEAEMFEFNRWFKLEGNRVFEEER